MNEFKMSLALLIFIASIEPVAHGMPQELEAAIIYGQQDRAIKLISTMTAEEINRNNGEILYKAIKWSWGYIVKACLQHPNIDLTLKNSARQSPLEAAEATLQRNERKVMKCQYEEWESAIAMAGVIVALSPEEALVEQERYQIRISQSKYIIQLITKKQEE